MSPRRAAILKANRSDPTATLHEHLIAATEQLLEQRSVGELTTRAIAQHAGVSDGVLYNHFDDKTELLMAAMLRRYGRLVDRLEAATPTAGEKTVAENVQAYGRALGEVEGDAMLHGAALLATRRSCTGSGSRSIGSRSASSACDGRWPVTWRRSSASDASARIWTSMRRSPSSSGPAP